MGRLVHTLFLVLPFLPENPGIKIGMEAGLKFCLVVDFVKTHPVFYFILITLKTGRGIPYEKPNQLPVPPPAALLHQMQVHFKMAQGDHRLDAVFQALVKHAVIELMPFLVRLPLIPIWKNPGPCNACPETLKTQLRKQLDVLFVSMVKKINGFMVGVIFPRHNPFGNPPGASLLPAVTTSTMLKPFPPSQ